VDPDRLDADEWAVKRSRPTLIDALALGEPPADREPDADDPEAAGDAEADAEAEKADPRQPSLRQALSWCVEELAQAQYALRMQRPPPPDPMTGWERFAASRLEYDEGAAVPLDLLLVAYLRWAGAHGEPVLAEEKILTWLRDHGATVRTAPLSQTTLVAGVRVVA
jgi:hypothetical protein